MVDDPGTNGRVASRGAVAVPVAGHVEPIEDVIERERAQIELRRRLVRDYPGGEPTTLAGISLSGGGVRSACFNLGLLEGFDQLEYPARDDPGPAPPGATPSSNHLELFDYVSSVSGGSYAAGHLATAMLPEAKFAPAGGSAATKPPHLGSLALTSKTIPGWSWGVGVWSLGVAFQLLKTGSLLVAFLALIAFVFRTLDSPDSSRFCDALGFHSDLARGFFPFWVALGISLMARWINHFAGRDRLPVYWVVYALGMISAYVAVIWCWHAYFRSGAEPLPLEVHYEFFLALPAPVAGACLWSLAAWLLRRPSPGAEPRPDGAPGDKSGLESHGVARQVVRLLPVLVALGCIAGLVTTGDIGLNQTTPSSTLLLQSQALSRDIAAKQAWIARAVLAALGATSLAFLFPKNLLKSARQVEGARAVGRAATRGRGWEPVFRVVVFLCSYGFILLMVAVLYGTVAHEDVSGYYEWRENFPSAAFHETEFRDPELIWERIARDAAGPDAAWRPVARRLMALRRPDVAKGWDGLPIERERGLTTEVRTLEALPWLARLFPSLGVFGPDWPRGDDGFAPAIFPIQRIYDANQELEAIEGELARRISADLLTDPKLATILPQDTKRAVASVTPEVAKTEEYRAFLNNYRDLGERYHDRAASLARLSPAGPAIDAAIRNNNRRALQLYLNNHFRAGDPPLPEPMRDRLREKVVFSSIVWAEDQWARLWIVLIAGGLWLLCCLVDVNAFSLQKFYRRHVIDSWLNDPSCEASPSWLHEAAGTYRGSDGDGAAPLGGRRSVPRRAPLLLFNATLEGNRSLGDEPDLRSRIFTFSPLSSGSGITNYWLEGGDARASLVLGSRLDLGNIVATSGAFLSPGTMANPALAAVLHLLNVQTGYWARDPERFATRGLKESLRFHVAQSLGIDVEKDSRFMLTDGAHVENLGLYVLLQRRCSLIIASDCSQEDRSDQAVRRFDALVYVLQQAGVDGIEVGPFLNSRAYLHWLETGRAVRDEANRPDCRAARSEGLNLVRPPDADAPPAPGSAAGATPAPELGDKPLSPAGRDAAAEGARFAREHYVFAQVIYPDKSRGLLVYLRPTLTGDEGDGLLQGAAGSRFPDDDPMDQFYTPSKMSTYRLLGRHIARELAHDRVIRDALGRVTRGESATYEPGHGDQPDGRPECDHRCAGGHPACMLNRQRGFRRPAAAPSLGDDRAGGDLPDLPTPPGPAPDVPINGDGPPFGPGSDRPGRRRRRRWRAWGRSPSARGGRR